MNEPQKCSAMKDDKKKDGMQCTAQKEACKGEKEACKAEKEGCKAEAAK
jgi:hypothetical protein